MKCDDTQHPFSIQTIEAIDIEPSDVETTCYLLHVIACMKDIQNLKLILDLVWEGIELYCSL